MDDTNSCIFLIQSAVERRSWHQGSGLMPVFEEDEEGDDWPGSEERGPEEEAPAETNIHSKSLQVVNSQP